MRPRDVALLLVAVAGCIAATIVFRDEMSARIPMDEAILRYELESRRSADVETLRLQPAADLRASFFSHMTLMDVYSPVSLGRMSGEERARWMRALTWMDAQLADALAMNLDALARRPGWAFHHAYAGEIAWAALRRRSLDGAAGASAQWETSLLNGIEAAPGNASFASFLAGAYIETWSGGELSGSEREVFRQAMRSRAFGSRNYPLVKSIVGKTGALDLLPDEPGTLRVALASEMREGDVESVAVLRFRLDDAERRARAANLDRIRERYRLGDTWGLRAAALRWVSTHDPEDLDDAAGRAEVAEVLALWPESRRGSWLRDPRARLVRYFLAGREAAVDGAVLLSTTNLLEDVPAPIRARVSALGGRTWEAEQLMRASGTRGSFEWTPAIVDVARAHLANDRADLAAGVIALASDAALGECNMALARRATDVADDGVREWLDRLTPDVFPAEAWTAKGVLALCLDPSRHGDANLVVTLESPKVSLVSWGWDGGRAGSVLVEGREEIVVELSGIGGRHPFGFVTEAGPAIRILDARIVRQR